MQNWISSLYPAFTVVAFFLIPTFLVIGVFSLYVRKYKAEHITPLTDGFLREAGHSLRLKYEDQRQDLISKLFFMMLISVFPFAITGAGQLFGKNIPLLGQYLLIVIIMGFMVRKLWTQIRSTRQMRLGLEAEIACGQALTELLRCGWYVFHDIPSNKPNVRFNIDHILIGPPGVFVVETKGRSKSRSKSGRKEWKLAYRNGRLEFPGWTETRPFEQAQINAKYITQWLSRASGVKFIAEPVLLFPGWYVEVKTKPPFPLIGNPEYIIKELKKKTQVNLTPEQCGQIAWQVEQAVKLSGYVDEKGHY